MFAFLLATWIGLGADVGSDTWVATDGLGRTLPTFADVGGPRADRQVLMFYSLWHDPSSQKGGPFDMTKILAADPEAFSHPNTKLFGPWWSFHYWGEPLLGYYLNTDVAVYRKHAHQLANAGVDAVVFDVSNGPTYDTAWRTLLDTFAEVESAGGRAPKIAFFCPFDLRPPQGDRRGDVLRHLWRELYRPGLHTNLWFRLDGKPLVVAYPSYCHGAPAVENGPANGGPTPTRFRKGHTYAQLFTTTCGVCAVTACLPTWNSKTPCAVTLRLRREGPDGAIVGEKRCTDIWDNGTVELYLPQSVPAGTYCLEMTDPEGTVGWWGCKRAFARGKALVDGESVDGSRFFTALADDPEAAAMRDFFTFRTHTIPGKRQKGAWAWLEPYPQAVHCGPDGRAEEMSVGVAQNCTSEGVPAPMSLGKCRGRRFHGGANDPDPKQLAYGPNFQEQWDRALANDPRIVFVGEWNEWTAQRLRNWNRYRHPCGLFVDLWNAEFSRDIEPVRGHWGDAYYWQLVANVRRYKGVRPIPSVRSAPIAIDGKFDDWQSVEPEFRDSAGDPMRRNHPGRDAAGPYVDTSGRNDIVAAKVSKVGGTYCFYVRTREPLTPPEGEDWMTLFVDVDRNASTGWCGYDLVVKYGREASVKFAYAGNEIELSAPASLFGEHLSPDGFDFKWTDHCLKAHDWTDFTLHGDAAPDDRFNFRAVFE